MDNSMSSISNPPNNQPFQPAIDAGGLGTGGQPNPPATNGEQTPVKRRPGRPKGSTKKHLLGVEPTPPKNKRPVGRPRKDGLPAGSVGPARPKRERNRSAPQYAPAFAGVPYPIGPYPPSISAPYIPQPTFQIDPSLGGGGGDEWADLARTNPNAFLGALLAALAAPNPVSNTGPSVEEAFKAHLVSLAPNPAQPQLNQIPSLYSILKTFWLPSSPAYFSLTASASTPRTPSEHRFLYWDPLPLVFNGVPCPSCSAPLVNNGRITSGPIKVYDIEKPFFIIGCEYVCKSPQCISTTSAEGRKYASTDSSILRSLPIRLKEEFPACLMFGDNDAGSGPNIWNWKALGISTSLWNMVHGCLSANLKKDVILHLIFSVQHGVTMGEGGEAAGTGEHKEEEEEDDDGEDELIEDQQQQQQAGPSGASQQQEGPGENGGSSTFPEAYSDTWKENTAMNVKPPTPSVSAPLVQQQQQLVTAPAPTMQAYTHYAYTIPPQYPFIPQQVMNGQHLMSLATPPHGGGNAAAPISTAPGASPDSIDPGTGNPETQQKRSPRHCCKCGSQECKGKGGRSFCMNPCQDCGKLDCKGRNSRRPDKRCSEGWA